MSHRHLAVYLNDHLAGAAAALEITAGLRQWTGGDGWVPGLHSDIEADRATLQRIMARLNVTESTVRKATGWLGEKLFELKLAMDDRGDGTLHALQLVETLALGIEGKRALWLSLRSVADTSAALTEFDFDDLLRRADDQKRVVDAKRLEVASTALSATRG